jgi:hypothetical protein
MTTSGANTADFRNALSSEASLAGSIYNLWVEWKSARVLAESRWTETKKYVFATSTHDTTNAKNPWSNSTHRPKLYNIYSNLLVNTDFSLFPHRDWLEFYGYDAESSSKGKRDAALAYLNTKHRMSTFRKTMRDLINDWILYGNCFAGVEYVTETSLDPVTGEQIPAYIGPRPYRISPYDIVMNPKSTDFQHSPKIVRTRTTIGELEIAMKENPSLGYDMNVLQMMKDERLVKDGGEDDSAKSESFIPDGFGDSAIYYRSGHTKLYEFHGDIYDEFTDTLLQNYVITVADGIHILRKEPLNTFSGNPNLFQSVWKQRPDNLWGFGPLDNLVGMQYRINHLENAKSDAFDNMLDPDLVIQGDPEIEKVGAATHYYVSEAGNVRHLVPDTTVLNADFQIQELETSMEMYANAPREALGVRSPGEKTAFEVSQLASAANRGFEYQTDIFSAFLEQVVNAELEVAVQNLHTSDVVSVIDDDFGVEEFIRITREDLVSNGRVVPVGAREYARKQRISQQLTAFYQTGLADPEVQQHFPAEKIGKLWSELLDFEEIFEPYGRIPERLEAATRQATAEDMLASRQQIDPTGLSEDDDVPEEELAAGGIPA